MRTIFFAARRRRWATEPYTGATASLTVVSVAKKRLIGMIEARKAPNTTAPFSSVKTPPGARTWAAFAVTLTAVKKPTATQERVVDSPRAL